MKHGVEWGTGVPLYSRIGPRGTLAVRSVAAKQQNDGIAKTWLIFCLNCVPILVLPTH